MKKKTVEGLILGAPDPEMNAIEAIAQKLGISVVHAKVDGNRVHPGNAYRAEVPGLDESSGWVWVECAPAPESGLVRERAVDHHHPGDPGFGLPPEQYWAGSSLGQICDLLGVSPTEDLRITAAADHCLGHAYRGLCPGVSPLALRRWRAQSRATAQQIPLETLLANVEAGLERLRALPSIRIGEAVFADALGQEIPELPEASAIAGVAVMYSLTDTRSNRVKVGVLNGTEGELTAWMAWAKSPESGLEGIYGDPARGYAGGYQK